MKRLRHPINSIREPFGTAGLIVAMIALLAALGGTAFAAAKLNSTQKKEVEKIAKKVVGKPGTNGTNGSNGSPGAAGKDGTNGAPGTNGTSVTTESFSTSKTVGSVTCTEGGTVVKSASPETAVCKGAKGKEGSPWTAGGTLPKGASEHGNWSVYGTPTPSAVGAPSVLSSISFNIPLASAPTFHYVPVGSAPGAVTGCPGSLSSPEALEGNLCLYAILEETHEPGPGGGALIFNAFAPEESAEGAGKDGVVIFTTPEGGKPMAAFGTWVVTGS